MPFQPCSPVHWPAGMVAEPGGAPHHLVLGYPGAQLAFLDCRMVSSGQPAAAAPAGSGTGEQRRLEVGVWKAVEAHSKGSMTALAAHPNAPLLATATNNQAREGHCRGCAGSWLACHASSMGPSPRSWDMRRLACPAYVLAAAWQAAGRAAWPFSFWVASSRLACTSQAAPKAVGPTPVG